MKRLVVILALLVVTPAIAVVAYPPCIDPMVVDVSSCGSYPPPGTCILINSWIVDRGCCGLTGLQHHQYILKEVYDCTGSGGPSCEWDIYYVSTDPMC